MKLVRFLMFEKGISKQKLSEDTGITMAYLEPIILGLIEPDASQVKAIADALGFERDPMELFQDWRERNAPRG